MTASHGSTPGTGPGDHRRTALADRLVLGGGVVFLVGLLVLAGVMVLFSRDGTAPGYLAALALLCPVGFAISFSGLVVQARQRRRE